MNKIKTKSEQISRPRPFLYMRGFRAAADRHTIPKMNSDVPKMNKKIRQDRKIPKKYIKKYKNGKIAERGFFWTRNFER